MGWMQKLCEAYDCGIEADQSNEPQPLVYVGFTLKKLTFRITLTETSDFASAQELTDNALCIVPSAPEAESRTGNTPVPFALAECLKYMVSGEDGNSPYYTAYMEQLTAWANEADAPVCLMTVVNYLKRGTILKDLTEQFPKLKYPGADEKSFVDFSVEKQGVVCSLPQVQQSWISHVNRTQSKSTAFCYVQGEQLPKCLLHPKVQGNAKLISAKDAAFPFQYKGRFTSDAGAATISYVASAKAHNALEWLIARQGLQRYGMTWVVWNTNGCRMDDIHLIDDEDEVSDDKPVISTFESYAIAVKKSASGYKAKLRGYDQKRMNEAVILAMTAATDGRMSITYYQELPGNEFVDRLERWYRSCCWWEYNFKKSAMEIGTPEPMQLAKAILGTTTFEQAYKDYKCQTSSGKVMKETVSRLLACIWDGQPIPESMVKSAFTRACAPLTFVSGKDNRWSKGAWDACLRSACAIVRRWQIGSSMDTEKGVKPTLDRQFQDRSYLYGRLLSVADMLEREARKAENDKNMQTNAIRLMQRFSQRPFEAWLELHNKLVPYYSKLKDDSPNFKMLFGEIERLFQPADRQSALPLDWTFIQGFSSQTQDFYHKKEATAAPEENIEFELPTDASGLYGCLLGIADVVECKAQKNYRRYTNALRLSQTIAAHPLDAWPRLHDKLTPYLESLIKPNGSGKFYQNLIGSVVKQFSMRDLSSPAALDSRMLNGYYQMRSVLLSKGARVKSVQKALSFDLADEISRDALFGAMLGIADHLERLAQRFSHSDERPTNALRLLAAVGQSPASGWSFLKVKLKPYRNCLITQCRKESSELEALENRLIEQGWMTNEHFSGSYIHFYYMERNKL